MPAETQERVHGLLRQMPSEGLAAAKELFWTELNYGHANASLSRRDWPDRAGKALAEAPVMLAQHESQFGTFDVVYAKVAEHQVGRTFPLSLTAERLVINQLLKNHPYALFLFSDTKEQHWHLVNVRYDEEAARRRVFRRIAIGPYERLRTASERVAMLDLASLAPDLFGLSPLAIQHRHDEAFDVEAVTREFFRAYEVAFKGLQADLKRQTNEERWGHDYALQFLNRLMFVYYVQRKRWLGDDPEFLDSFWHEYQGAARPMDTFVSEWLWILFFEAFNDRFQAGRADRQYLPSNIRGALAGAPYLNGGLFEPNELDRNHQAIISDRRFRQIFDFLQSYNFTISEDTPLDQEVAVDPEMIGKVYESLVNVSAEADERGEAGIFYTPRVEIDLMCRLALVDWLTNHLGRELKSLLCEAVFAFDPDDKERADAALADCNLWPRLNELLRNVTMVDPACGSGSFLVGMLYVLDDLLARGDDQLGREQSPYERKKRIIASSLYGVDVMDWAVHVAELRLWLQLVIDTDLAPAELKFRPLLPNLSFKVRAGDSLVQEVGGINLALRQGSRLISTAMKGRITKLKGEKLKFYNNDDQRKYRTAGQLQQAELQLFRDILEARAKAIKERLKEIANALRPQVNLFGEVQSTQMALQEAALQRERDRLQTEQTQVTHARQALRTAQSVPFVWDIAFVEVFEGRQGGFDIVIGNPPYVRTQKITDPRRPEDKVARASKERYKGRLARSVYASWPRALGYDWATDKAKWKLSARGDLYIYFYFHGLSLLNEKGAFCFITSNSWMDADYGKDLQEFLLTRGQVKLVIDNQARRSFASARVNTAIVLLGAPQDTKAQRPKSLEHVARFVMLTVPFEHVLDPVIWEEVDEARAWRTTKEYRVFPIRHAELLESGVDPEKKHFASDKWGGKYLRAPSVFHVLNEKGSACLARVGEIADVMTYMILPKKADKVIVLTADALPVALRGYFRGFVRSPRYFSKPWIDHTVHSILACTPSDVAGNTALHEFVLQAGMMLQEKYGAPPRRDNWYVVAQEPAEVLWQRRFGERHMVFFNPRRFLSYDFYRLRYKGSEIPDADLKLAVVLMSTPLWVFKELYGRVNLGEGALKTEGTDLRRMRVFHPASLPKEALSIGRSLLQRAPIPLRDEIRQPDRRALDDIIFDVLGLTQGEREAVYEAVVNLVETRLSKARSLEERR